MSPGRPRRRRGARLRDDLRVDASRIGVMGRSYGGFMTLTLAGRHPELWSAAVDMFGPYDLLSWSTRLPESWRTYFRLTTSPGWTTRHTATGPSPPSSSGTSPACPVRRMTRSRCRCHLPDLLTSLACFRCWPPQRPR
ncbi:MAG TPA: prolyl oligopeptidase family serine peptidase [Micromonosporaceae bacterium]|nr:prolyl oligopeptidase family serine peptidase [Micromonosporaceae bacterium]